MFKLILAPVRFTVASVRGIAWTRAAFGRRRPRVVVQPSRTVVVRVIVEHVPPTPDRTGGTNGGNEGHLALPAPP